MSLTILISLLMALKNIFLNVIIKHLAWMIFFLFIIISKINKFFQKKFSKLLVTPKQFFIGK